MSPERRFASLDRSITGNKLGGYAALYNVTTDLGACLEMLAPTAFRSVLESPNLDTVGLLNHDENQLLARTKNGSLRLATDSTGLEFEMDLKTTLGNSVREMVDSGLLTGCSFSFKPGEYRWDTYEGRRLWVQTSVARLKDVSVVAFPQYPETTVSVRSMPAESTSGIRQSQLIRARMRVRESY
ncbi:HK97 family phage prohead protease [Mycolicibacterium sp. Y3]